MRETLESQACLAGLPVTDQVCQMRLSPDEIKKKEGEPSGKTKNEIFIRSAEENVPLFPKLLGWRAAELSEICKQRGADAGRADEDAIAPRV